MAIALNLTAPLKQDPESQQRLAQLAENFAEQVQPLMDAALAESETVHFARVVVIGNQYLQILTEFDGDPLLYTEFFRTKLGPVFEQVFSLVEGAPAWDQLNTPDGFFKYTQSLNLPSLGASTVGNEGRGYLFSALGDATVQELKLKLNRPAPG
jgi:hypothetical protein